MELLLNLAWMLLAVPAWWLWRGRRSARKFGSLQCLLALGCALFILFPIVSATDDLRAMRAEIEESPASKRSIRQSSNDKASAWKSQNPPALVGIVSDLLVVRVAWQPVLTSSSSVPPAPAAERAARAPPIPILA